MLPSPNLDDRRFEQIVQEARKAIPKWMPDWTDENAHDPGITLIELFAWLTEMQQYYINRVPERNQLKFLKLLGMKPELPRSAQAQVSLSGVPHSMLLPRGTPLLAQDQPFETMRPILLHPARIDKIIVRTEREANDYTSTNDNSGVSFYAFGQEAREGSRLYIAFDREIAPGDTVTMAVSLHEDDAVPLNPVVHPRQEIIPSARVSWKFYGSDTSGAGHSGWMPLQLSGDETVHLMYSGTVTFRVPGTMLPVMVHPANDRSRFWICCSVEQAGYENPPRVEHIALNTVPVEQRQTYSEFFYAGGEGGATRNVRVGSFLAAHGRILVQTRVGRDGWVDWSEAPGRLPQGEAASPPNDGQPESAASERGAGGSAEEAIAEPGVLESPVRSPVLSEPEIGLSVGFAGIRQRAGTERLSGRSAAEPTSRTNGEADPTGRPAGQAGTEAATDGAADAGDGEQPPSGGGERLYRLARLPGEGAAVVTFGGGGALAVPPRGDRTIRIVAYAADFEERRLIGRTNGLPRQRLPVYDHPLQNGRFGLQIAEERDGMRVWRDWTEVEHFDGSGPADRHFVYDEANKEIGFGDNERGSVPAASAKPNVRLYALETGGGTRGNVKPHLIDEWAHPFYAESGLKPTNHRFAAGGTERETLGDCIERARLELRRPFRAVTADDVEYIVRHTPGLRVARVKALPLYTKGLNDYPRNQAAGHLTVAVVPYSPVQTPQPSPGFIETVRRHLDDRRLITTEVSVIAPEYVKITVHAVIVVEPYFVDEAEQIVQALAGRLKPLDGKDGSPGWPFGRTVYKGDLYGIMNEMKGVAYIQELWLDAEGRHWSKTPGGDIELAPYGLVYSGEHEIELISRANI